MVHMCSRKMCCVDPDENQLKSSPKHSLVISMKYYCGRPGLAFSHAGILQTSRRPWFVGVVGSSEIETETLKGWGHAIFYVFFPGNAGCGQLPPVGLTWLEPWRIPKDVRLFLSRVGRVWIQSSNDQNTTPEKLAVLWKHACWSMSHLEFNGPQDSRTGPCRAFLQERWCLSSGQNKLWQRGTSQSAHNCSHNKVGGCKMMQVTTIVCMSSLLFFGIIFAPYLHQRIVSFCDVMSLEEYLASLSQWHCIKVYWKTDEVSFL